MLQCPGCGNRPGWKATFSSRAKPYRCTSCDACSVLSGTVHWAWMVVFPPALWILVLFDSIDDPTLLYWSWALGTPALIAAGVAFLWYYGVMEATEPPKAYRRRVSGDLDKWVQFWWLVGYAGVPTFLVAASAGANGWGYGLAAGLTLVGAVLAWWHWRAFAGNAQAMGASSHLAWALALLLGGAVVALVGPEVFTR